MSDMEDMQDFGTILRRLRLIAGLSQRDVENRGGPSEAHQSRLENGAARPRPGTVTKLLGVLRLTMDGPEARELLAAAETVSRTRARHSLLPSLVQDVYAAPAGNPSSNKLSPRELAVELVRSMPEGGALHPHEVQLIATRLVAQSRDLVRLVRRLGNGLTSLEATEEDSF